MPLEVFVVTTGVNFINVLRAALCAQIPKAQKTVTLSALLGSVYAKAAHRTLIKLTPAA
jgi:hypothetical protein